MTGRKLEYWVIPPKADGEFVANMEAVLDTYATPYDSRYPVVCMDEQPVQLLKETRVPIPATTGHPRRVDYEYERAGVASLFMFCEPLVGWRQVTARERRTKVDWAVEVAALLNGRYATAEKVILVCDNLNTHTIGAFYEAFDPATARALYFTRSRLIPGMCRGPWHPLEPPTPVGGCVPRWATILAESLAHPPTGVGGS